MNQPRSGFVNVDALQAQTSLEQAAVACGYHLPELKPSGKEARLPCPFHEDGESARSLAVNLEHPQKVFICHSYQCKVRGNLLLLMYGWLHGDAPPGEKLTGAAFREVRDVLAGIHGGDTETERRPAEQTAATTPAVQPPAEVNTPLKESEKEAARNLAMIDDKFVRDVAAMNPKGSRYVRTRPYLTPEVMEHFRMGFLPADGGGDKRGWSLRSHIIYPLLDEQGEVLAWIGRDPAYEEKHEEWDRGGRGKAEPVKHRFPKGFQRGLELFGQHLVSEPNAQEPMRETGLVVVEGFNDVIRLWALGQPSVAICSNEVAEGQLNKIARFATEYGGGRVTLMFDCQETGDKGAKEALWKIAQTGADVRLAWSRQMHGGRFAGKQPESLSEEDWGELRTSLARRGA